MGVTLTLTLSLKGEGILLPGKDMERFPDWGCLLGHPQQLVLGVGRLPRFARSFQTWRSRVSVTG